MTDRHAAALKAWATRRAAKAAPATITPAATPAMIAEADDVLTSTPPARKSRRRTVAQTLATFAPKTSTPAEIAEADAILGRAGELAAAEGKGKPTRRGRNGGRAPRK